MNNDYIMNNDDIMNNYYIMYYDLENLLGLYFNQYDLC